MAGFSGLGTHLGNLWRLSSARSRSISPENFSGEKGRGGMAETGYASDSARDLGVGWKVSPAIRIAPGETRVIADIDGPGAIQHIWMTVTGHWRHSILMAHWDHQEHPSIEVPVADFFGCGWGVFHPIVSLPICVNPGSGFNSHWEMPFRKHARISLRNVSDQEIVLYYQIDYCLTDVPDDAAYLHARFGRVNPVPYGSVYTLLDGVRGAGHYVGCGMSWGSNSSGWWGEGELKVYLDGDGEWPTICGTGTEDYFGGSYNFEQDGRYRSFSTPYSGFQVLAPDGTYKSQTRFSMYRWHIGDPIRFSEDIRVTIQALGWRSGRRYLPLQDDLASVALWYQTLPSLPLPPLPDRDALEVI